MNSYQILAIISLCLLVFSAVVGALVFMGIPILAALIIVYLFSIWLMTGMQRRARECADAQQQYGNRRDDLPRTGDESRDMRGVDANHSLKP